MFYILISAYTVFENYLKTYYGSVIQGNDNQKKRLFAQKLNELYNLIVESFWI